MDFPISDLHLSPLFLAGLGFVVGVLGGFFGVGGSFLAGPALFAGGVPMHLVVGTDLAHIVGKSIVAARRHRALGNVDIRLGLIMVIGTVAGVEAGAQAIEFLQARARVDWVVGLTFIVVLLSISAFTGWESWRTLRSRPDRAAGSNRASGSGRDGGSESDGPDDHSVLAHVAERLQRIHLPPHVSLPVSGIGRISVWIILAVAFVGGFFGGFLGGGAGFIRLPAMIYLLGVPTHVAIGTDLFEIVISAGYGTVTHALKGNVDILIALVMHTGAALGAQIGVVGTQRFTGPRIRLAFVPLPLVGAALVVWQLATGTGHG